MPNRLPEERGGPLGQEVARSLRRSGIFRDVAAAWVLASANEVAKGRFRAVSFRDGELTCVAATLPVAELHLASREYLAAINKKLGRPLIRHIRFKQS